jgi:hypothetical protein
VELHALKSTYSEREQAPLVLEPPELPLDGGATLVELARAGRLARDQRVQAPALLALSKATSINGGLSRETRGVSL